MAVKQFLKSNQNILKTILYRINFIQDNVYDLWNALYKNIILILIIIIIVDAILSNIKFKNACHQ